MKKLISFTFAVFIMNCCFAQNTSDLIGLWKFSDVSSTNSNCKDVSYFPINSFHFKKDGKAEFKSEEGIANADYKVVNSAIRLTNLIENGVNQAGMAEFEIKNLSATTLTLVVLYECGSIDIIFKK